MSMANEQGWPSTDRTIMLQSVLVSRAQETYTALSGEDRKDYPKVKAAVLKAFEFVPEAYRLRFRTREKKMTHKPTLKFSVN